jgi:hypothetical protein
MNFIHVDEAKFINESFEDLVLKRDCLLAELAAVKSEMDRRAQQATANYKAMAAKHRDGGECWTCRQLKAIAANMVAV